MTSASRRYIAGHLVSGIAALACALLFTTSAFAPGCCKRTDPSTSAPSASASAGASPLASASASARPARLIGSFDASLHDGKVVVAGPDRDGDRLLAIATSLDGTIASVTQLTATGEAKPPGEVGVYTSSGGVAIAIEGQGGAWHLGRAATPETLATSQWEPVEATVCGTTKGLFTVRRAADGFQVFGSPIAGGDWTVSGIPSKMTAASLLCGSTVPFLFGDDGDKDRQIARAFRDGGSLEIGIVEEKDFSDEERGFHTKAQGDELFAMRIGETAGVQLRRWDGTSEQPSAWLKSALTFAKDAVFAYVLVTQEHVVIVMTRANGDPRSCPDGDVPDTIAEVAVIARLDGHVIRPSERIESWRCDAEPGPFFGGVVKNGILIAWPRGPDVACAKQKVRFGGLGYVTLNPTGEGPRKLSTLAAPSEGIEFAGCDGTRCVVAAIDRTHPDGTCAGPLDPDAGEVRILSMP